MIRVAVVLPNYVDGKLGGTQTFVDELVSRIANHQDFDVTVLCQKGQALKVLSNCNVERRFIKASSKFTSLLAILQVGTPKISRVLNSYDLAFFPLQSSFRVASLNVPTLATVHDVQHLDLPNLFSKLERSYRHFFYDRQSPNFTYIATDSEFSRKQILHHLSIEKNKICTILIGTRKITNDSTVRRENFLLYPARGWPHKNHKKLFEAIRLVKQNGHTVKLLLTGEPPTVPNDLTDSIENLGRIEQNELDDLYRKARALIFPSLYEGFGLPPIEAMSAGCPVLVSNAGSLPEVCGDSAIYFNPLDVNSIFNAIINSEEISPDLIERGKARASELNWDSTAEQYMALMRSIASKTSNC